MSAPEPQAAILASRTGPALAHTKLPARSENRRTIAAALSLRAASPVVITAPVSTSSGRVRACAYACSK